MLKKITIAAVAAMLLTLTACGNSTSEDTSSSSKATATEAAVENENTTESETEETTTTTTSAETAAEDTTESTPENDTSENNEKAATVYTIKELEDFSNTVIGKDKEAAESAIKEFFGITTNPEESEWTDNWEQSDYYGTTYVMYTFEDAPQCTIDGLGSSSNFSNSNSDILRSNNIGFTTVEGKTDVFTISFTYDVTGSALGIDVAHIIYRDIKQDCFSDYNDANSSYGLMFEGENVTISVSYDDITAVDPSTHRSILYINFSSKVEN